MAEGACKREAAGRWDSEAAMKAASTFLHRHCGCGFGVQRLEGTEIADYAYVEEGEGGDPRLCLTAVANPGWFVTPDIEAEVRPQFERDARLYEEAHPGAAGAGTVFEFLHVGVLGANNCVLRRERL